MFLAEKLGTGRTFCPIRLLERETSLLRNTESCFSTRVGSFFVERMSHVARALSHERV